MDRQLVGGECKLLQGHYNRSVDRELVVGDGKRSMGSSFEVWIESLLVERISAAWAVC